MRFIRLYSFSPKSQPPTKIQNMHKWFVKEVSSASIEPIETYEITEDGPSNGNATQLPLARKLFDGLMLLKKAYQRIKRIFND